MHFELDDEQTQLQDSVRRLLADHGRFEQRRASAATDEGFSRSLWQHFAALGITALTVPEQHGGFGRGPLDMLPVLQACGHALVLEPVLASAVLGSTALGLSTDLALQQRVLPGVACGATLLAWAHDEAAARHAPLWVDTRATLHGGRWQLDGGKVTVLHGAAAQHIIVTARVSGDADDGDGLALFLVDGSAAGVQRRAHRLVDDTPAAELVLTAATATPLADPHHAQHAHHMLQQTLTAGIAAACADMLGTMTLAFELAVAYMHTRQQFGRFIGENQALRHKAAEMHVSLEMCRSMALAAALAASRPDDAGSAADLHRAKLMLGKHGRLVCQHAVQIHGGIGMTEEYAVGHALRRVHVLDQLFGDSGAHSARLGSADLTAVDEPSFSTLLWQRHGLVLVLTLNRPHALNAMTAAMRLELCRALDLADADDGVRAIVFTGNGRGFCAGFDLAGGPGSFAPDRHARHAGEMAQADRDGGGVLALRLFASTKPLIAAVNGAAVGIGATMLLPMDIRLASTAAKVGFVFTRRGIVPDGCASWFLPRVVGISTALDWSLSGRLLRSDEARAGGLFREVLEPDDLLPRALAVAQDIAQHAAPVSVALTRQLLWRMSGAAHPMDAHRVESRLIAERGRSADAREGVAAFLDKRPTAFPAHVSTDMPASYPWWNDPPFAS